MTEMLVLAVFAAALVLCLLLGKSVLFALIFGFFLFSGYSLSRRYTVKETLQMAWRGIMTAKNVLLIFILIGMITAAWRAAGVIPYIVYHTAPLCTPHIMLLATFLLCSLISFLTGTSFGTASTMGVICASLAGSMGLSPVLIGGAVLSGASFGDRCSPMSTSALLVSAVTKTDIYGNIKRMVKTSLVPFCLTCVVYFLLGWFSPAVPFSEDVCAVFAQHFVLSPWLLTPAVLIVVLSLFKISVKITMPLSILAASLLAVVVQEVELMELLRMLVVGYDPADAALAALISGGGILSMKTAFCIVCLSSAYAGIFETTGLLHQLTHRLASLSKKVTTFGCVLLTSIVTGMVACNQTLCIMLTQQLCVEVEPDEQVLASYLENTAVVIAALIPWSIACSVPLTSVNAPPSAIFSACYLYLIPLWNLLVAIYHKRRASHAL